MARETLTTMPEPTNPENNEGNSLRPSPTRPRPESASISHGVPTSPESQRTADAIAEDLAREFQQRRGGATTTFEPARPIPTERPSAPLVKRRTVLAGLGLGAGLLGILGLGASRLLGKQDGSSRPTPGVSGGVPASEPATLTPAPTATDIPAAAAPRATEIPTLVPQIIPGTDRDATATPGATKGPDGTSTPAATTRAVDGTPAASGTPTTRSGGTPNTGATPPKEGTTTPEVKKEFGVKVNIIRPGDKKYEDVFGPIGEIPVKEIVLNDKFVHPSGLTAEQMQKRANSYAQAAARYSNEWWDQQLKETGKKPQGRPSDISLDNPKIKEYMDKNEPYTFSVWGGDRMFSTFNLTGEETLDPSLGHTVNIIPVSVDAINKMRVASMPAAIEANYRIGVEDGRITYNLFATPNNLKGGVDGYSKLNKLICYMMNATQNIVLIKGLRDGGTPPNFLDQNLVDMYFSSNQTDTSIPDTAKVGTPLETPLYVVKS